MKIWMSQTLILAKMLKENIIYDWSFLTEDNCDILSNVFSKWKLMLSDSNLSENHYHEFISSHAGFMLDSHQKSLIAISKLKLDSEFETDFVVIHEGYSNGLIFEFIELESPHDKPYNKNGQPSAKLTSAIQQIQNWREWLAKYRMRFGNMMPNFTKGLVRDFNLKFTIIIGRRDSKEEFVNERNTYGDTLKIQIRSFDHLSDIIRVKMRLTNKFPLILLLKWTT